MFSNIYTDFTYETNQRMSLCKQFLYLDVVIQYWKKNIVISKIKML